jgi:hypothetical protein
MRHHGHWGAATSKRRKNEHEEPMDGFGKFMVVGGLCRWIADQRTFQFGSCAQRHFDAM